jgi:hypothetical protein
MSEELSADELRLQLTHALDQAQQWQGRALATGQELHRTKMLLEVAETKYANLEKILNQYPVGKTAREIALTQAVRLSGPLDSDDVLRTAIRFESWLLNNGEETE